jgi:putative chitinase
MRFLPVLVTVILVATFGQRANSMAGPWDNDPIEQAVQQAVADTAVLELIDKDAVETAVQQAVQQAVPTQSAPAGLMSPPTAGTPPATGGEDRNVYSAEGPEAVMSAPAINLLSLEGSLERGASGNNVRDIQYRLNELGYDIGRGGERKLQKGKDGNWVYLNNSQIRGVDGVYGPSVDKAVRQFQEDAGLEVTGIVDASTANAMANSESVRFKGLDTKQLTDSQRTNYTALLEEAQKEGIKGVELAALMAQAGHESDTFNTLREYASGSAYEGREDLGNTEVGDGKRYRGRGHIQLTGRANYRRAGEALGLDLENNPELVETDPSIAARVTIWFWKENVRSQAPDFNDVERVTKVVNGGFNGLKHRIELYENFAARFNENVYPSAPDTSPRPQAKPTQE